MENIWNLFAKVRMLFYPESTVVIIASVKKKLKNMKLSIIKMLVFLFAISLNMQAQDQPNFIFILTDDQSYGYLGCEGNDIVQTPNIDKLASEGVHFTNAHITSAICTPSRVSILLSQYERRHGVNFNSGTSVSEEAWANAYPAVMRKAGYYTGWIGKNHAPVGQGGYESGLMEKSFDYWYAGHGHLSFYPKDRHAIFKNATSDTQVEVIQEGLDDFLDNETKLEGAMQFIGQRPANQPFMLSICFNLPHSAGTGTMKMKPGDDELYKTAYRDLEIPLPDNYIAKAEITNPKLPGNLLLAENRQAGYDFVDTPDAVRERYIRQLQAMTGIDRLVGKLRDKLREQKLDKNTVLVFTSDHGLFMGQYGLGGKALCYEVTTHVPMIIYDPQAPAKARKTKSTELVQSIDIGPTMLARAGIPIPDTYQGKDLNPLLQGQDQKVRKYLFTENLWSTHFGNPRCEAVQDEEWKYIRYYENNNFPALKKIAYAKDLGLSANKMLYAVHDPGMAVYRDYVEAPLMGEEAVYEELYHLKIDPQELRNLADEPQYSEQLEVMKKAWWAELQNARGDGKPAVLRYTADSKLESGDLTPAK